MGVTDIRILKRELRDECKKARRDMPLSHKAQKDEMIFKRLTALPEVQSAKLILTYVSTPIEVSTFRLIDTMLRAGKAVAVPRCADGIVAMDFYRIHSMQDLEPATFSVLEPKLDICKKVTDFSDSVCIIPGLSFDLEGYRLGYGKGYYDRFLNRYHGVNIGICYNSCIRNELPHGRFDVAASILVTEKFVKRIPVQENKPMPKKEKPLLKRSFSMVDRRRSGGHSQG